METSRSPLGPLSSALLRWCAYAPGTGDYVALAALLEVFEAGVAAQHSCLPLEQAPPATQVLAWSDLLRRSGLLGPELGPAPLVLWENALYLAKDARYESALAEALLSRAAQPAPLAVAPTQVRGWLEALFGAPGERPCF